MDTSAIGLNKNLVFKPNNKRIYLKISKEDKKTKSGIILPNKPMDKDSIPIVEIVSCAKDCILGFAPKDKVLVHQTMLTEVPHPDNKQGSVQYVVTHEINLLGKYE